MRSADRDAKVKIKSTPVGMHVSPPRRARARDVS